MIDTDYTDDLALLTNTLAQAKSLLLAPGYTAGIQLALYLNANKTEFI